MKWYEHVIGIGSMVAGGIGFAMMIYALAGLAHSPANPGYSALPPDANACLKAGFRLVINFKSNVVTCEDR